MIGLAVRPCWMKSHALDPACSAAPVLLGAQMACFVGGLVAALLCFIVIRAILKQRGGAQPGRMPVLVLTALTTGLGAAALPVGTSSGSGLSLILAALLGAVTALIFVARR